MRIGELAARAGVTTKAIRYYEERGLVKARRTPAGYRDFDDTSLEVIAMIRNAQRLGVKLGEMDEIIALIRDRQRPCASVRGIIRAKRRDVAERIASLIELDKSQSRTIAHRHRQSGSRRPRPFCRRELPHRSVPNADVILMGHVLHGENEDAKRRLIAKAFDALPDGGALIVFEELIDEERSRSAFALLMSLNMLIETPAGFNTTGGVYCNWIRQAGFSESRIEHLVGPESMIVAIK